MTSSRQTDACFGHHTRLLYAAVWVVVCVGCVGVGCGSPKGGDTLQPVDPSFSIAEGATWTMRLSGDVSGEFSGGSILWRSGDPDRINLSGIAEGEQTSIDLYVTVPEQRAGTYETVRRTTLTRGGTQYTTEDAFVVTIDEQNGEDVRGAFRGTLTMRGSGDSAQRLDEPIEVIGRFDSAAGE